MKKSYMTPEFAVFEVRADERFTAQCTDSVDIGNWDNPTECIVTRGDGPKVWFMNS
ncbi:MAG TPA: hypothetical protein K8U80_03065 [Collinsella ihuae]|uniref:Uncharacterized protein n=1 Tax=Collinsella ihumii TaxID=1720204 RepID=A0A921IN65_9ACTN|nr:hypothetical protein [Collinsella ihumii]